MFSWYLKNDVDSKGKSHIIVRCRYKITPAALLNTYVKIFIES